MAILLATLTANSSKKKCMKGLMRANDLQKLPIPEPTQQPSEVGITPASLLKQLVSQKIRGLPHGN